MGIRRIDAGEEYRVFGPACGKVISAIGAMLKVATDMRRKLTLE